MELRGPTVTILLQAAAAGAGLDDLKIIAAAALERRKAAPECTAAVQAVLDALGKRQGSEDTRSEAQRWHDALRLG